MNQQEGLSQSRVRKIYAPRFPGTDLHHIKPKSRNGGSYEFNLFPYLEKAHSDYHFIFWNLSIEQIWAMVERIHSSIFESREDYVLPWWFEYCQLDVGSSTRKNNFKTDKQERLRTPLRVDTLRDNWIKAFGGPDLITAEESLKLMMLFMIFGTKMVDRKTLFNNGHLVNFYERSPCTDMRLWAFEICFGQGGTSQGMKSKITSIIKRRRYYADILL